MMMNKALVERQTKNDRNHDTPRNYTFISIGSTLAGQWNDGSDGPVAQ